MTEEPAKNMGRFQFDLRHLFYAVTLLAASLSLFGAFGIWVALVVLALWWSIFHDLKKKGLLRQTKNDGQSSMEPIAQTESNHVGKGKNSGRSAFTWVELLVVNMIILILVACLLPAVRSARDARISPHWACHMNLAQVAMALETYQQNHGSLPPAYVADSQGRPMHSWRVLILPQLGRQELYDQYRFDEPWDGPHNRKLLGQIPDVYRCNHVDWREPGTTSYLAVTGNRTAWPGATPRTIAELDRADPWSILVVEAEFQPVPWTAPKDLAIEDASQLLSPPDDVTTGHWHKGFFSSRFAGRPALWTDSTDNWIPDCAPEELDRLLILDDGKPSSEPARYPHYEQPKGNADFHPRKIHYGNIARLVVFLVVACWPVVWLWQLKLDDRRAAAEVEN